MEAFERTHGKNITWLVKHVYDYTKTLRICLANTEIKKYRIARIAAHKEKIHSYEGEDFKQTVDYLAEKIKKDRMEIEQIDEFLNNNPPEKLAQWERKVDKLCRGFNMTLEQVKNEYLDKYEKAISVDFEKKLAEKALVEHSRDKSGIHREQQKDAKNYRSYEACPIQLPEERRQPNQTERRLIREKAEKFLLERAAYEQEKRKSLSEIDDDFIDQSLIYESDLVERAHNKNKEKNSSNQPSSQEQVQARLTAGRNQESERFYDDQLRNNSKSTSGKDSFQFGRFRDELEYTSSPEPKESIVKRNINEGNSINNLKGKSDSYTYKDSTDCSNSKMPRSQLDHPPLESSLTIYKGLSKKKIDNQCRTFGEAGSEEDSNNTGSNHMVSQYNDCFLNSYFSNNDVTVEPSSNKNVNYNTFIQDNKANNDKSDKVKKNVLKRIKPIIDSD